MDNDSREPGLVNSPQQLPQPSFLARQTIGQPHYLLLALAAVFVIALVPRGAHRAIQSNTNKAEDWLPKSYAESTNLLWFRDHFQSEQFALVSWEGCTLGNTEKLEQLSRKLVPSQDAISSAPESSDLRQRARWYPRVISGPSVIAELVGPPLGMKYGEAVKRIEGALVGPAQRDAHGNILGNETRTTCLIVYLSTEATKDKKTMRQAIENISLIAAEECAIPRDSIHVGGPPAENIEIDTAGERSFVRLAALAGLIGFAVSYWCFRSLQVTAIVVTVGVLSAVMSLAIVFYYGIVEVMLLGADQPQLGTLDAFLILMPAVVYVLGLSGAIHIVNYYRGARREKGLWGAAEAAVRQGWLPCTLAALTTAVVLGSLVTSDILPIKKFGFFTLLAELATIAILFTILPVLLHRFPLSDKHIKRQSGSAHLPAWMLNVFGIAVGRNVLTCLFWLVIASVFALGITRVGTSVQPLKLFDKRADLIHDYAWLESHLGNLAPLELVLTVPSEKRRSTEEHAEQDGRQYRMTMLERLDMLREIQLRMEALPEISGALSAATFALENSDSGVDGKNKSWEERRNALLAGDYLRLERMPNSNYESGRELWRISARAAALSAPHDNSRAIDYGQLLQQLKSAIDPVLVAYEQRDTIVEQLHKQGKQLDGARLCILHRTPGGSPEPALHVQESVLANLLLRSGVQSGTSVDGKPLGGVTFYNLAEFDSQVQEPQDLEKTIKILNAQDALILASASSDPTVKKFVAGGLNLIDVTAVPVESTSAALELSGASSPSTIHSVYTGVVPLLSQTQRQLTLSLKQSLFWASLLVALTMIVLLRSAVAGLVSMLPIMFPLILIFGAVGWLGVKVDIGMMLSASIALAVAVDGTIHFLTWFRRGSQLGLDRVQAIMFAYDRCSTARLQTTIIGGIGVLVFAASSFMPMQNFGYLMISILAATVVGDLLLLPALLAGPLGYYFGGKAPATNSVSLAVPGAFAMAAEQLMEQLRVENEFSELSVAELKESTNSKFPLLKPRHVPAPTPALVAAVAEIRKDVIDGPHADLHARLRNLRRESSQGRHPS